MASTQPLLKKWLFADETGVFDRRLTTQVDQLPIGESHTSGIVSPTELQSPGMEFAPTLAKTKGMKSRFRYR